MVINRSPELAEIIPSIGARIALQNYFFNNNVAKETKTPSQLSVIPISTPCVTPTLTVALTPQKMFDVTSLDNETPVNINTQVPIENIIQSLHVETSSVNDTQNIVLLNTNCDDEPPKKIQRIETMDISSEYHLLYHLLYYLYL